MMGPDITVVIPYFDDQPRLTLLLRALDQQAGDVALEVVVADDGSPEPPVIPAGLTVPCRVVRQEDHGFRAAAARNLGAGAATGELLLFLDGDMLPGAGYVAAMSRRLREIDDGHGALVVGRRRHVDLSGVGSAQTLAFLAGGSPQDPGAASVPGSGPGPRLLEDPQWLRDGYTRTDGLRSATDEDFRLVISAVLGVDRRLWESTGGFDEEFVGYGGEDWDFGWRAWQSGALFAHEPDAVAWHDGPDAAGRGTDLLVKNAECLRLARTIPLPSVRGTGLVLDQPAIVVRYLGPTSGTATDAAAVACVAGLLAGSDAAVWFPRCSPDGSLPEGRSPDRLPPLLSTDPRVHAGDVPPGVLGRSRYQVWVRQPLRISASLARWCETGDRDVPGMMLVRSTRALRRGVPPPSDIPPSAAAKGLEVQLIPANISLERWWGGW
jgi:GT2 family glycosyltransferase